VAPTSLREPAICSKDVQTVDLWESPDQDPFQAQVRLADLGILAPCKVSAATLENAA